METKPTIEAIEARIQKLDRREDKGLFVLYNRLITEMGVLRRLWEDAHHEAGKALARMREPGWPSGDHSLARIAVDIERVRGRVEALQETIDLLEAEGAAGGGGKAPAKKRYPVTRADGRVVDASILED